MDNPYVVVGVSVGVILAALLFMRRMAEISSARLSEPEHHMVKDLPADVIFYEITGPLFFGAAQKAMTALATVGKSRAVIIDIESVPIMDVTGLVALESAIERLNASGSLVVIGGAKPQPMRVMRGAGLDDVEGKFKIFPSVDDAVAVAKAHSKTSPPPA